ncbi:hypothetical protein MY11210_003162 [Beauveria gryllotalpidicola]
MVSRNQSRQTPEGTYTHECYTQRERLVQNLSAPENWRGDVVVMGFRRQRLQNPSEARHRLVQKASKWSGKLG